MLFRNGLWVLLCCTWPRRKINNKHPEHIYAFDTIMRVIKSTIRITPIHLDDDRGAENSRTCNNKSDGGRKNICLMCENFFPVPRRFFFHCVYDENIIRSPCLVIEGENSGFFPYVMVDLFHCHRRHMLCRRSLICISLHRQSIEYLRWRHENELRCHEFVDPFDPNQIQPINRRKWCRCVCDCRSTPCRRRNT